MVPLIMPLASFDSEPVPMTSYDQKHHVTPHFSDLDLRNATVPLMMSLA